LLEDIDTSWTLRVQVRNTFSQLVTSGTIAVAIHEGTEMETSDFAISEDTTTVRLPFGFDLIEVTARSPHYSNPAVAFIDQSWSQCELTLILGKQLSQDQRRLVGSLTFLGRHEVPAGLVIQDLSWTRYAFVDSQGCTYELPLSASQDSALLAISSLESAPVLISVPLRVADRVTSRNIDIEAGSRLDLQIVDCSSGAPLDNLELVMETTVAGRGDAQGRGMSQASRQRTDSSGSCSFRCLPREGSAQVFMLGGSQDTESRAMLTALELNAAQDHYMLLLRACRPDDPAASVTIDRGSTRGVSTSDGSVEVVVHRSFDGRLQLKSRLRLDENGFASVSRTCTENIDIWLEINGNRVSTPINILPGCLPSGQRLTFTPQPEQGIKLELAKIPIGANVKVLVVDTAAGIRIPIDKEPSGDLFYIPASSGANLIVSLDQWIGDCRTLASWTRPISDATPRDLVMDLGGETRIRISSLGFGLQELRGLEIHEHPNGPDGWHEIRQVTGPGESWETPTLKPGVYFWRAAEDRQVRIVCGVLQRDSHVSESASREILLRWEGTEVIPPLDADRLLVTGLNGVDLSGIPEVLRSARLLNAEGSNLSSLVVPTGSVYSFQ
jgi:hypothetical protein